ncbi:MAG: ATP-binding protein [Bdellovibrionales bacterium]
MIPDLQQTVSKLKSSASLLWSWRGVWLRGLFCLVAGVSFLTLDSDTRFDERFQMRGSQTIDSRIILVQMTGTEWNQLTNDFYGDQQNIYSNLTDNYYWDSFLWSNFLKTILKDSPANIAVTFLFDGPSDLSNIDDDTLNIFANPKVTWAASLDKEKRPQLPSFVNPVNQKSALILYNIYDDGIARSFPHSLFPIYMAEVLARTLNPNYKDSIDERLGSNIPINYMGPPNTYPSISFKQVLDGKVPSGFFEGKIVIVGHHSDRNHQFYTPVGYMSRSELLANSVDNLASGDLITSAPTVWYVAGLLLLLIVTVWIIIVYPQMITVVLFFGIGIVVVTFSFWLFDTYCIWSPILAPIVQIFTTFVIFTTRQLSIKENLNWRLEEEKRVLTEVKNLKDNFVSLISHDLKTPIAKIQAIVDRTINEEDIRPELKENLLSLRNESEELNRYIQGILKVLRVESSDFKLNNEPTDLNKIINDVIRQVKSLADAKNIIISNDLDPLFLIDVDRILVHEVILNLIENAIKYTPPGGFIKVSSTEIDDQVVVVVEDSGVGIDKSELAKVFEKFHRGKEHSLNTKGSGLGLYLVKYFIELHGGEVFLESERGQGTTIGFTLPIQ